MKIQDFGQIFSHSTPIVPILSTPAYRTSTYLPKNERPAYAFRQGTFIANQRIHSLYERDRFMKKTIMIVEDYDDIRTMMKVMIELYGYDVVLARDGSEAVANAKQFHPDIILMDLSMPNMDGLTATKLIRETDELLAQVPIVAITGHGKSHAKQAYESGCDKVLEKPINFNVLKPMLQSFLK